MLAPYNGNEPYIFISYAHKDTALVSPVISGLMEKGFRVWYDEGIEGGFEWPEFIATKLFASSCVLAFISRNAVNSKNCRREINFAIDKDKPLLAIYLEDFELPLGMQMQLNTLQALYCTSSAANEALLQKLGTTQLLQGCLAPVAEPATETLPEEKLAQEEPEEPAASASKTTVETERVAEPESVEVTESVPEEENLEVLAQWECTCGRKNAGENKKCACGNWHCACGNIHPPYVTSCVCGLNKWDSPYLRPLQMPATAPEIDPEKQWQCTCGKWSDLTTQKCTCGNWRCVCGRIYPPYVFGCSCGKSKNGW